VTTQLILILAQLCVAEIGFPEDPPMVDECQIMWVINDERAGRWRQQGRPETTILEVTRLYNSFLKCAGRKCDTPRMKWVRDLDHAGIKPRGWPTNIQWRAPRHQGAWFYVLERAEHWLKNGRRWPRSCGTNCRRATQYGGEMDEPRACWTQVDCGARRQIYWAGGKCRKVASR
jgi:hypothetical protein